MPGRLRQEKLSVIGAAKTIRMNRSPVFVDTGYFRALIDSNDRFHHVATAWRNRLKITPRSLVTTTAVLLELGNQFTKPIAFNAAMPVFKSVVEDARFSIVPIDLVSIKAALQYRIRMQDKSWGLVDCTSFLVMRSLDITEALACDKHFEQAGFRALLLE